jgi:hypothetical protein
MGDVLVFAGDEVIYADDLMALRQEQVGEIGAEKAGGAGNENTHIN